MVSDVVFLDFYSYPTDFTWLTQELLWSVMLYFLTSIPIPLILPG